MPSRSIVPASVVCAVAVLASGCDQAGTAPPLGPSRPWATDIGPPAGWAPSGVDRDRVFVFSHTLNGVVPADSVRTSRYILYADGQFDVDNGPGTGEPGPAGWYIQSAGGGILFAGRRGPWPATGGLVGNTLVVIYNDPVVAAVNGDVDSVYCLRPE